MPELQELHKKRISFLRDDSFPHPFNTEPHVFQKVPVPSCWIEIVFEILGNPHEYSFEAGIITFEAVSQDDSVIIGPFPVGRELFFHEVPAVAFDSRKNGEVGFDQVL